MPAIAAVRTPEWTWEDSSDEVSAIGVADHLLALTILGGPRRELRVEE
jgi:hypothetical protein